jgi:hypothetical protein
MIQTGGRLRCGPLSFWMSASAFKLNFMLALDALWVLLSRWWPGWRRSRHMVRPDTVTAWHRRAFAWYGTRKSRPRPGRNVPAEIRDLIRNMSQANPLWGTPAFTGNCSS